MLAAVPGLPRPVVLLEDGAGQSGKARLAWGARRRLRLEWSGERIGDAAWLRALDGERRAYGVIAYDLGLPPHARRSDPPVPQPLVDFFEPEHEVVVDLEADARTGEQTDLGTRPHHPNTSTLLSRSFTQAGFESAVRRIKDYIAAGDVYQVNLALAERFRVTLSPWEVYLRLREINPSPWMGFADFGDWQVVSGSPELLVEARWDGGTEGRRVVRARPIAGTRKKTGNAARDAVMRSELCLDEKEQAEHRMLLDLARNDVGRVAQYGTVEVSEREVIEEYSHLFHLVSEVRGVLQTDCSAGDVIAALFPGGTITGAPKISAMEVIAELEPVARGMYTGALGWVGGGELQLNIMIRSAVLRDGIGCVQAGAGIVWDSDPEREWRESLRKGAAVRAALGLADPARSPRDVDGVSGLEVRG